MSKILFINLRCLGDIFFSTHLADAYKKQNPHSEISYLVYQESAKSFKALSGIERVYEVDRKTIITLSKSPLFSPEHAINYFFENIEPVTKKEWDVIVNFSNDPLSTNITSALKILNPNASIAGNFRNSNNQIFSSTPAAKYLNEVMSQENIPIHYADCYFNLSDFTFNRTKNNSLVKKSTDQNKEYFFKINALRNGQTKNVIGIQLKSSSAKKDIPFSVITEYIQSLLKNNLANPVLLVAPIPEEINYAKDISDFIGQQLTTIDTDFNQLGSVLLNLDLLLTPDTSVKHLADINEVPMIEYLGTSTQLKQATITENNYIIIKSSDEIATLSNDLISLTQKIFYPEANKTYVYSNIVLSVRNTSYGVFYFQNLSSQTQTKICEKYFINKIIFNRLYLKNNLPISKTFKEVKINTKVLALETSKLRDEATQLSRLLLNCLRSVLSETNDRNARRDFLLSLSELLSMADKECFLQPIILNLKADLENIKEINPTQNKKFLELLFFDVKKQVMEIGEIIKEFETCTQSGPRNRFMEL